MTERYAHEIEDPVDPIDEVLYLMTKVRTAGNELARRTRAAEERLSQVQERHDRAAGFAAIDLLASHGPLANVRNSVSQEETALTEAQHDVKYLGLAESQMRTYAAERDKEVAEFLGGKMLRLTLKEEAAHCQIHRTTGKGGRETSHDFPRDIIGIFATSNTYDGIIVVESMQVADEKWGAQIFQAYQHNLDQHVDIAIV